MHTAGGGRNESTLLPPSPPPPPTHTCVHRKRVRPWPLCCCRTCRLAYAAAISACWTTAGESHVRREEGGGDGGVRWTTADGAQVGAYCSWLLKASNTSPLCLRVPPPYLPTAIQGVGHDAAYRRGLQVPGTALSLRRPAPGRIRIHRSGSDPRDAAAPAERGPPVPPARPCPYLHTSIVSGPYQCSPSSPPASSSSLHSAVIIFCGSRQSGLCPASIRAGSQASYTAGTPATGYGCGAGPHPGGDVILSARRGYTPSLLGPALGAGAGPTHAAALSSVTGCAGHTRWRRGRGHYCCRRASSSSSSQCACWCSPSWQRGDRPSFCPAELQNQVGACLAVIRAGSGSPRTQAAASFGGGRDSSCSHGSLPASRLLRCRGYRTPAFFCFSASRNCCHSCGSVTC